MITNRNMNFNAWYLKNNSSAPSGIANWKYNSSDKQAVVNMTAAVGKYNYYPSEIYWNSLSYDNTSHDGMSGDFLMAGNVNLQNLCFDGTDRAFSRVTNMSNAFPAGSIKNVVFNWPELTNGAGMFHSSYLIGTAGVNATLLNLSFQPASTYYGAIHNYAVPMASFQFPKLQNASSMFEYCNVTGSAKVVDTITDSSGMYYGCRYLTGGAPCPPLTTNTRNMYMACINIVGPANIISTIDDCSSMYNNCWKLAGEPVSPSVVRNMDGMYENCIKLEGSPVVPDSLIGNTFDRVYCDCKNITGVAKIPRNADTAYYTYKNTNVTSFDGLNAEILTFGGGTFQNCVNLVTAHTEVFDKVNVATQMFWNCRKLTDNLYVPPLVERLDRTYVNCFNLNVLSTPITIPMCCGTAVYAFALETSLVPATFCIDKREQFLNLTILNGACNCTNILMGRFNTEVHIPAGSAVNTLFWNNGKYGENLGESLTSKPDWNLDTENSRYWISIHTSGGYNINCNVYFDL